MKAKFIVAIVCALAIIIGAVSGFAASENFFDKSIKGDYDLKAKLDAAKFEAKAESMGMTVEELGIYLAEEFEAKAESMNMTLEEYKVYLEQQEKEKYEYDIEAKAESIGMTVEEYKEKLKDLKEILN